MLYFGIWQENTNIRCLYLSDLSMVQACLTGFNSMPFFFLIAKNETQRKEASKKKKREKSSDSSEVSYLILKAGL